MIICVEDSRLETLRNEHAETLFRRIDEDRQSLRNWLAWVDGHTQVDDTLRFIERSATQLRERNGMSLGLWTNGDLAGVAGLHYIDWNDHATSVGFWLGSAFRGRGLVTRAVFGLMTLAFEHYGLERFEGRVATGNAASRALFERLGFQEEGVLRNAQRLPKGFVDHVVYSVIAGEWPSLRSRWPVSIENPS